MRAFMAGLAAVVLLTGLQGASTPAASAETDRFVSLTPTRFLDTRETQIVPAGDSVTVQIAGVNAVPADAEAVAINLTVTGSTTMGGFLTVYPSDTAKPTASNLNFNRGQTVANQVLSGLSPDGKVTIETSGRTHVIVDVTGYFRSTSGYRPMTPKRLLDSREAIGIDTTTPVAQGGVVDVTVAGGETGVPDEAVAVAINLTSTQSAANGWVTAFPTGTARPTASNLNYSPNRNVPGFAIVKVGQGRKVSLFTSRQSHLIADVQGFFLPGGEYVGLTPARLVDTRIGAGAPEDPVMPGRTLSFKVTGGKGVPASGVSAVFLNVTSVDSRADGYTTVFPHGGIRPKASTLNYATNQTIANSVMARVGTDGRVALTVTGASDVVVDVAGYVLGEYVPPGFQTTVATWNLCAENKCGMANWNSTRRLLAAQFFDVFSPPDILATQETHEHNSSFDGVLPDRYAIAEAYKSRTIFYDTAKFVVEDSAETQLGSQPRYAVWARFRDLATGGRFIVADAHLEPSKGRSNDLLRRTQTQLLINEVTSWNTEGLPVIYAGDYNSNPDNANQSKYPGGFDAPAATFDSNGIPDAIKVAPIVANAQYNSANQQKNPPLRYGHRVDQIYVSPTGVQVDQWAQLVWLDGSRYKTPFVTDHNLLRVIVTMNAS